MAGVTRESTAVEVLRAELSGLEQLVEERDRSQNARADSRDQLLDERDVTGKLAIAAALASADRANSKAEAASDKRFDSVNEFRATLDDHQKTLMTKTEGQLQLDGMKSLLHSFEARMLAMEARNRELEAVAGMKALLGSFESRVLAMEARDREQDSRGKGTMTGWGLAIGVVGVVSLIVSVILAMRK